VRDTSGVLPHGQMCMSTPFTLSCGIMHKNLKQQWEGLQTNES
jgi:hypothetical protein